MRVHSTYILTTEDAAADDEDEICRELCLWRASVLSTEKTKQDFVRKKQSSHFSFYLPIGKH